MMNQSFNLKFVDANGLIIQSLEVLDFSVIHLSVYERLLLSSTQLAELYSGNLNPILHSTSLLQDQINLIPLDKT